MHALRRSVVTDKVPVVRRISAPNPSSAALGAWQGGAGGRNLASVQQLLPRHATGTITLHGGGNRQRGQALAVHAAAATMPVLPPSVGSGADKYRYFLKNGGLLYAAVDPRGQELFVTISVPAESLPDGTEPVLQWGMFRTAGSQWLHPSEVVPPGSKRDEAAGVMNTPLALDKKRDVWEVQFKIRKRLAPVNLAFVVYIPDMGTTLASHQGKHFVVPVGMAPGSPEPLGPSLEQVTSGDGPDATCTLNFAVFSRHASGMSLCILRRDGGGYLEVALDPATNRTGDVWHVQLEGLRNVGSLCYGWRASGAKTWADGGSFHPAYIMLDPYCPRAVPVTLPQAAYDSAPLLPPQGKLPGPVLLGSLAHLTESFNWGRSVVEGPSRSLEDSVLLELDVAEFTTGPQADRLVPPEHRGTYLGVIDRIPDIVASGATAVVLSNVFLSSQTVAPPPDPAGENGGVSWPTTGGKLRRPLSFMAPEVAMAAGDDPVAAASQLKALVAALHDAGLEVLLEAEFCLTAEVAGGPGGRLQSMAGLDGDMYVRGGGGPRARGVLNTGQTVVRQLVRASLHHWISEYRVDGFVLVNAENLAQDALGAVWDSPAMLEELSSDPVLKRCKLIVSGADGTLLPRMGERGVPHYGVLAEWNARFPRDILALLRDNIGGHLSSLATRLMGSPDLTAARWDADLPGGLAVGRRPAFSINALMPPGGAALLTLAGGDADLERGEVVARSLLLALAVAQGTPALNTSVLARAGLRRFAAAVLELRRKYRHLLAPPLLDSPRDITWHDASATWEPDWSGEAAAAMVPGSNYIGFSVRGLPPGTTGLQENGGAAPPARPGAPVPLTAMASSKPAAPQQAVYVGFNPNPEPTAVNLPPPPAGMQWRRLIDTSRLPPDDIVPQGGELLEREYILAPGAALMLDAASRSSELSAVERANQAFERLGQT